MRIQHRGSVQDCIAHREAKVGVDAPAVRLCRSPVGLERPICSADCGWIGSGGALFRERIGLRRGQLMAPGRPYFPPEPDIGIGIEPRQDRCSPRQSWGRDREASAALKWRQRLPALSPT
jgi:hypothetical protein